MDKHIQMKLLIMRRYECFSTLLASNGPIRAISHNRPPQKPRDLVKCKDDHALCNLQLGVD